MAGIGFTLNYNVKNGNGLGPRTLIVSVNKGTGDVTQADLNALVAALTIGKDVGDTNDAFTVAGVSSFDGSDPLYLALQGTGTVGTGAGDYVADITLAVVAEFNQIPA